jgi:hypothetical protein
VNMWPTLQARRSAHVPPNLLEQLSAHEHDLSTAATTDTMAPEVPYFFLRALRLVKFLVCR